MQLRLERNYLRNKKNKEEDYSKILDTFCTMSIMFQQEKYTNKVTKLKNYCKEVNGYYESK